MNPTHLRFFLLFRLFSFTCLVLSFTILERDEIGVLYQGELAPKPPPARHHRAITDAPPVLSCSPQAPASLIVSTGLRALEVGTGLRAEQMGSEKS